jgi:hypothetical protein
MLEFMRIMLIILLLNAFYYIVFHYLFKFAKKFMPIIKDILKQGKNLQRIIILNNALTKEKQINKRLTLLLKNNDLSSNLTKTNINELKCSICFENNLNICCVPCGHTYCNTCILNSHNCFICRGAITCIQKIYI